MTHFERFFVRVVLRRGNDVVFALFRVLARLCAMYGASMLTIIHLHADASSPRIAASRTLDILYVCTVFYLGVMMIVKMLKMRLAGVEVPKRRLHDRYNSARPGTLEVVETTDQGLHRLVKLARFTYGESGKYVDTLFDVNLLWYRDGRMVLSGFERSKVDMQFCDYAQSWLCFVGTEPPPMPEGR
ncbi:hypothetical protein YQ44_06220 [Janthinobacterium sp. 1_2014MBL_MicDiv]|nr:hypothetical protein YQ44_06220 [Janthinobacterium sp. 1_2014MBL_MicDiv]